MIRFGKVQGRNKFPDYTTMDRNFTGMKYSIVIAIFLGLGMACKVRQPLADAGHGPKEAFSGDVAEAVEWVEATKVPYTWFSATGQGKIDWEGERFSARVNVRIRRDSIIWVQISKLGFEVGRMLVTPDSAFFINRLERTYGRYNTKAFLKEYNVPADFEMFSSVFTAGAYMPKGIQASHMEDDGSLLFLSGSGMQARHWFDGSSLLIRSLVTDPKAGEWASAYSDYKRTQSGFTVPFKRQNTLIVDGQPHIFDLEYSTLEIDTPLEFPFSIPSHYEKI
jgi:hypothetical protein